MNKSEIITGKQDNQVPSAILNELENKINSITIEIENESDELKKETLEIKRIACKNSLEKITSEVDDENFMDSIDQIKKYEDIGNYIKSGLDDNKIDVLKSSDLWPFINEELQSNLIISKNQIETSGNIKTILNEEGRVDNAISENTLKTTEYVIHEATHIRLEKGKEYLNEKLKNIQGKYEENKDLFDKRNQKNLGVVFREAKDWFKDNRLLNSAEKLEDLNRRLNSMEYQLNDSLNSVNTSLENKSDIKKEILEITNKWNKLLEKYDKKLKGVNENSNFQYIKSEISKHSEEIENIDELNGSELLNLYTNIKSLNNKYETLNNLLSAKDAINKLKEANNIQEVKDILNDESIKERIETVGAQEFEGKYRKYTTTGDMVVYEQGNEWKIIIKEGALEDEKNVEKLKKQLTHEFMHVVFENDNELKDKTRDLLVNGDTAQWNAIKETFFKAFPNKEASNKKVGWTDDDILSELYAIPMGTDKRAKVNGPKDKLNNLVYASAILGKTDIDKKIGTYRGYEDDNEIDEDVSEGREISSTDEDGSMSVDKKTKEKIDLIENTIKDYLKEKETGYVPGLTALLIAMQKFHEKTKEALNETGEIIVKIIEERTKKVEEDLEKIAEQIRKVHNELPNGEINPLRAIWNSTTFLSISDFVGAFNQVYEFFKRRNTRKEADHAAKIGMALFGSTDLGNEATANQLKAEQDEVSKWEGDYANLDTNQLQDKLDSLAGSIDPSKDQFKAILRTLAKKGSIDWRNKSLWKVLNKLQVASSFKENDEFLLNNELILGDKLHKAMGEIWDYEEYTNLTRDNESNYESGKKKYAATLDTRSGHLNEILEDLLNKQENGQYVDAQEFESILDYAFEIGRSHPIPLMFYTMQGLAKGILPIERAIKLGNLLQYSPTMEWLQQKPTLTQKKVQEICKENFKDEYKINHPGEKFKIFFRTVISNNKRVQSRTAQNTTSSRGSKWDKDAFGAYAYLGEGVQAGDLFRGKSGNKLIKPDAIANVFTGALDYCEDMSKKMNEIDIKDFKNEFIRQSSWLARSIAIVESRASLDSDIISRTDSALDKKIPSEGGVSNHENWTFGERRNKLKGFLFNLDRELFTLLDITPIHGKGKGTEDEVKNLKEYLINNYTTESLNWENMTKIDDVYEEINKVTEIMINKHSDSDFKKKVKESFSL